MARCGRHSRSHSHDGLRFWIPWTPIIDYIAAASALGFS